MVEQFLYNLLETKEPKQGETKI